MSVLITSRPERRCSPIGSPLVVGSRRPRLACRHSTCLAALVGRRPARSVGGACYDGESSDPPSSIAAIVVALVGLVWVAQGLGAPIGGGFMIGDPFWILAGLALVAASIVYAAWPRLRRR